MIKDAVENRDERLTLSRRFEKLFDQAPLSATQRHLIAQGFHNFLSNTFWCDLDDGSPWFSVWEGSCYFHSTVDVEYNTCLWYLTLWPQLLELQFAQWARFGKDHAPSGGAILSHDIGHGCNVGKQAYPHDMPVEENCNYLLMLQAYCHWTGNVKPAQQHVAFVERLAKYLIWADRNNSGFPNEGNANTIDDASPAMQYSRKQTYLAVKRLTSLQAAADLLERGARPALAGKCRELVETGIKQVESQAWLGDHYAVCVDRSAAGIHNVWTGKPLPYDELAGWDSYSIYTGNGLLLPTMIGQPRLLDSQRLDLDITNSLREAMSPYGCGHSSSEPENVWISQNLSARSPGVLPGAHVDAAAGRAILGHAGDEQQWAGVEGIHRHLYQQQPVLLPARGRSDGVFSGAAAADHRSSGPRSSAHQHRPGADAAAALAAVSAGGLEGAQDPDLRGGPSRQRAD